MDKTTGCVFPSESLTALQSFLQIIKVKPWVLHQPELSFFKDFIETFGGSIPPAPKPTEQKPRAEENKSEPIIASDSDGEEIEESDVELDNAGVIDNPDQVSNDEDVEPASLDVEIDEENVDKANEKKREGISLYNEGEYEKAVQVFTEAIKLNPSMSLLYAKRGQCHLQLRKPNACIKDCTNALKINPDNAAAYKFRGRAHRLLGHWLEAAQDLRSASKIDFDEQVDEWLKEVTPNVRKLEEHKRRYERLRTDREIKQRRKKAKKAREEHEKATRGSAAGSATAGAGTTKPPSGKGDFLPDEFKELFSDPEIQKAMEDPDVQLAFSEISMNPANMMKYTTNPKIMGLINQLSKKLNKGGASFPGGFPGFGGFPGASGGGGPETPPSAGGGPGAPPAAGGKNSNVSDDIGLD